MTGHVTQVSLPHTEIKTKLKLYNKPGNMKAVGQTHFPSSRRTSYKELQRMQFQEQNTVKHTHACPRAHTKG